MAPSSEENLTEMVIKVKDLSCGDCYKRLHKILHKFPEIQDRSYDETVRTVTMTVSCCDPETLRDRLCREGRGFIRQIDINHPKKKKSCCCCGQLSNSSFNNINCADVISCCCGGHSFSHAPPPCHYCICRCTSGSYFDGSGTYAGRHYYYRGAFASCVSEDNTQGCNIM